MLALLTPAVSKIFCTAVEISGPIPSPGINVTNRFYNIHLILVHRLNTEYSVIISKGFGSLYMVGN